MAPALKDQSFRITALCIRRFCLGYRNKAHIPTSTTRPDIFSASIVIATAFIVVCLMLILLLILLETIRLMTISRAASGLDKNAQNIAQIYNGAISSCPPTFPEEGGTCPVCLEEYQTTTIGRKMPCDHFFHVACIDRWILQSASKRWPRDVVRCPVCKQPLMREHVEVSVEETPLISEQERLYSHNLHLAENMA